jgi:hypothetical protein
MTLQLFIGDKRPCANKLRPVKNRELFCKPAGGLWTSTYTWGKSDWVRWCIDESFRRPMELKWYVLRPASTARIYTINSFKDLVALPMQKVPPTFEKYVGLLSYPDFEGLSQKYDGIHLTRKGERATRWSQPSLYGWDCESTLWFRWVFEEVKLIKKKAP